MLLQRAEKQTNEERESIIMHHYEIYAFWYPILKYLQKHRAFLSLFLLCCEKVEKKKKFVVVVACLRFCGSKPTTSDRQTLSLLSLSSHDQEESAKPSLSLSYSLSPSETSVLSKTI